MSLIWNYTVAVVPGGTFTSYFLDGDAVLKINATGDTIYLPNLSGFFDVDHSSGTPVGWFTSPFPLFFADKTVSLWELHFGRPWEIAAQAIPAGYKSALADHEAQRTEPVPIEGTGGDDVLEGTDGPDRIVAGAGTTKSSAGVVRTSSSPAPARATTPTMATTELTPSSSQARPQGSSSISPEACMSRPARRSASTSSSASNT